MDVVQGRMNGAPNETRTHSFWFASQACLTIAQLEAPFVQTNALQKLVSNGYREINWNVFVYNPFLLFETYFHQKLVIFSCEHVFAQNTV